MGACATSCDHDRTWSPITDAFETPPPTKLEVSPAFASPLDFHSKAMAQLNLGGDLCTGDHDGEVGHDDHGKPVLHAHHHKKKPDVAAMITGAGLASVPWQVEDQATTLMNTAIGQFWPFLTNQWEEDIRYNLGNAIKNALPEWIKDDVSIEKCNLPEQPGTFKRIRTSAVKNGLRIVASCVVAGGADLQLRIGPITLGITKLEVVGNLVIELAPLLGERPIVGAMRIYFVDPPDMTFQFTGALRVADLPIIRRCVRHEIDNAIENALVQPNCFTQIFVGPERIPAPEPLDVPQGVLRVRPVRASKLQGSDWSLFGKSTSDSYVQVRVGGDKWTSSTVKSTCDPVYPDEYHDFVIYNTKQVVFAKVYDDDWANEDDFLGVTEPRPVEDVVSTSDKAQPLYRATHYLRDGATVLDGEPKFGDLTLRYEWLKLATAHTSPKAALEESCAEGFLLAVEILKLRMPPRTAHTVQVQVKTDRRKKATMHAKTPQGNVAAAMEAVDQAVKTIILNGHREGIDHQTLAKISGVKEDIVKSISMGSTKVSQDMQRVAEESVLVEVPFGSKLFMTVSSKELLEGHVHVSVQADKKQVVAAGRFALGELGSSWPTIHRQGEGGEAVVELKSELETGGRFILHAMFSIVHLHR